MREAPEAELWTKWLLPDGDRERLVNNAIDLNIPVPPDKRHPPYRKDGEEFISKTPRARL